jgi:DNA-binding transcriptional LysR family regulator
MKLFQIEYLVAVCRYGSISQAADALLVSRPAVSRAVRDLEEEFGVPLLQRNTTGVVLTEAGQVFYEKCLKIQQMLAELGTEMASFKCGAQDESDRVLSIGISFTARCVVLPFINAFHHEFPEVKIRLTDIERAFLDSRTLVPDYDLEIALCSGERVEGVEFLNIRETFLAFCCSKQHPLAGRSHVSVMDLKDEPLVALSRLEKESNQMTALFASHGLTPNIVYLTNQMTSLRQMIRENICSSIKPRESMENDPEIATIPVDECEKLYMRILWNGNIRHNKAFHDFISYAKTNLIVS